MLRIRHVADVAHYKLRGHPPAVVMVSVPDALEDVIRRLIDHPREFIQVLGGRGLLRIHADNTETCSREESITARLCLIEVSRSFRAEYC